MIEVINKYFNVTRSGFKNVFSLVSSNVISRFIFALGGIFLAKHYGPENYGEFNVFISYATILSVFSVFSVDKLLLISNNYKEIRSLLGTIIFWIPFVVLIFSVFVFSISFFTNWFDVELYSLLYGIIGAILLAYILVQNAFYNKYAFYKIISFGLVLFAFSVVTAQLINYFFDNQRGLIHGYLIGLFVTSGYLLFFSKSRLDFSQVFRLKKLIKKNKNILIFNYPSTIVSAITQNILPILILYSFGNKSVGEFSLVMKITILPVVIISYSLSKVYFQKIAKMYLADKSQIFSFTLRTSIINFILLVFSMLILNTIGVWCIDFYFDKDWASVSNYFIFISFYFIAKAIQDIVAQVFVLFKENQILFWFNLFLIPVLIFCLILGKHFNDFFLFIKVFSLIVGTMHLLFFLYALWYTKRKTQYL